MQNLQPLYRWLHRSLGLALLLTSLWLGSLGLDYHLATRGEVVGSEFGMLIALVNALGALMLWVMVYGLWRLSAPRAAAPGDK